MMNIHYDQPHLLFPLLAYSQSQYELIDQFVPELANVEARLVNLTNIKQFEDLLYHLETTFLDNDESYDYPNEESYLKIPSIDVFRLLITLASRFLSTKWTHGPASIDGLIANSEYVKNMNEEYDNCIYKSRTRHRCIMILRRYINILMGSKSQIAIGMVYNLFLVALKDFIIQPKFFHIMGTLPRDKQLRPSRNRVAWSSKINENKQNITLPSETSLEQIHDIISDSEEEPPSLLYSAHRNVADELKKFQPYNISPLKKNNSIFATGNHKMSGLNDSSVLFHSMRHLDSESDITSGSEVELNSKRRKGISNGREKRSFLDNIKVFGDYLISRQLNPIINSPYSLWKLIQWTFYCADLSSMYQRILLDSSSTNCHLIYDTYTAFIQLIIDFIAFNFVYYLTNDEIMKKLLNIENENIDKHIDPVYFFFQCDGNTRKSILDRVENDRNILLLNLMAQLGPSPVDWYDRIIEYVFTGLNKDRQQVERSPTPQPCYEREKILIRHDNTLRVKKDNEYMVHYDDNMDSMILRYRIMITVYYRSLFFSNGEFIQDSKIVDEFSFSELSPENLLQQLSSRLAILDCLYLTQFYLVSSTEILKDSQPIPKIYHSRMMLELTKMILVIFTRVPEIEEYLLTKDIRCSETCLPSYTQNIIDLLNDLRIYQALIEDETYSKWNDFEQVWCKSNYLLGWLLEVSLIELKSNLIESTDDNVEIVKYIYKKVEIADRIKVKCFNRFILNHCNDSNKSDNNHVEYHFYLSDNEALELFVNDKTLTKWAKYKDIVNLKFFNYTPFVYN